MVTLLEVRQLNKQTTKENVIKNTTEEDQKISKNAKVIKVLANVSEICDYAISNFCISQPQFEELECLLNKYIK